jgi:hypothetical protein
MAAHSVSSDAAEQSVCIQEIAKRSLRKMYPLTIISVRIGERPPSPDFSGETPRPSSQKTYVSWNTVWEPLIWLRSHSNFPLRSQTGLVHGPTGLYQCSFNYTSRWPVIGSLASFHSTDMPHSPVYGHQLCTYIHFQHSVHVPLSLSKLRSSVCRITLNEVRIPFLSFLCVFII